MIIERNEGSDDDEVFTSKSMYKKLAENFFTKKRAKLAAEEAEQKALNEERREYNEAMKRARDKLQVEIKVTKKSEVAEDGLTDKDRYVI